MVLSMDRWIGQVAIVTGANSGIGKAIATRLVEEGLKVVGVDIETNQLELLAENVNKNQEKLYYIKTDLTKEEDILNVFTWIKKTLGPISILINCAGISTHHFLLDEPHALTAKILAVNVGAVIAMTQKVVENMRENNIAGHIIHINSICGHEVLNAKAGSYSATKYAITALTEALRLEFMNLGLKIKVTSVSPGIVDTPILTPESRTSEVFKKILEDKAILQPENIADGVIYVLSTPPHVQVHELTIKPVGECWGK